MKDRIEKLQSLISERDLDAYIVPRVDEFQNEFVAPYAERLKWLTGFTGSAGTALILKDKAVFFTDARYTLQAKDQLDSAVFEIHNIADMPLSKWVSENKGQPLRIGFDPWLVTIEQLNGLRKKVKQKAEFIMVEDNLIDQIWDDQPARPAAAISVFADKMAGRSRDDKIKDVQSTLKEEGMEAYILTSLTSIAWLLNIRGEDIDYIPVALAALIIPQKGPLQIFSQTGQQFSGIIENEQSWENLAETLSILKNSQKVGLDETSAPVWFSKMLDGGAVHMDDPCSYPRSIKSSNEQAAIKQAHILDGVAITKFIKWLENNWEGQDELKAQDKLLEFRAAYPAFKQPSFPTIMGFGSNGAIIHYRSAEHTNKKLEGGNLLLFDSGGQYYDGAKIAGTTDITRTVAIGKPSADMIRHYTLVLKGHIAVAAAKFPVGTTGAQLDALARKPLWDHGLDYAHGTGHGVGCYLSVHEEAANLSPRCSKPLKPGMLLSNEPGYYKEGAYGIRLENLLLVKETGEKDDLGRDILCFDTITFAPFDEKLIDCKLLSNQEKIWLDAYEDRVHEVLK